MRIMRTLMSRFSGEHTLTARYGIATRRKFGSVLIYWQPHCMGMNISLHTHTMLKTDSEYTHTHTHTHAHAHTHRVGHQASLRIFPGL